MWLMTWGLKKYYKYYKNLQHKNYKDESLIINNHSKMHSIVCWNPYIIFIVTSNYKSYGDYHAPLVQWSLHKYKFLWGMEGNDWDLSF